MLDAKESPLRFSLATLVSILCLAGIYFAGLRFPSGQWAGATVTLTLTIMAVSLVWRFTSPRADTTFWNGFHIAGWAYLAIVFAPQFSAIASAALLTPRILAYAHLHMPLTTPDTVAIEWHGTWYPGSILDQDGVQYKIHYTGYTAQWDEWVGPTRIRAGGGNQFSQTGHAMLALLVAAAGGVVAKCYSFTNRRGRVFWSLLIAAVSIWATFGIVSLFYPNDLVTSTVFTVSISVLIALTIGAVATHSPRNPFLIGASVLGWCYFLIHIGPFGGSGYGPTLLTTWLIASLQNALHPQMQMPVAPGQPYMTIQMDYTAVNTAGTSGAWQTVNPISSSFQIIAHSHLMLLGALIGGLLGYVFSGRQKSKPNSQDGGEELIPTPPEA